MKAMVTILSSFALLFIASPSLAGTSNQTQLSQPLQLAVVVRAPVNNRVVVNPNVYRGCVNRVKRCVPKRVCTRQYNGVMRCYTTTRCYWRCV